MSTVIRSNNQPTRSRNKRKLKFDNAGSGYGKSSTKEEFDKYMAQLKKKRLPENPPQGFGVGNFGV